MAILSLTIGFGQQGMVEVADKINTAVNLNSMITRIGGGLLELFPEDFQGFEYLKFRGVVPYSVSGEAQTLDVLFRCYGTPVVTADDGWVTGFDAHGVINGDGSDTLTIAANAGAARVTNIRITVTGSVDSYQIEVPLNQAALSYSAVSLGYHLSVEASACSAGTSTYYILTGQTFATATSLFGDSGGGSTSAGYYSDGARVRYWNGSSFTTLNLCTM